MNCDQLRVAFAGTPEFAAVALDALIASDHEIVGVLTQPDRPAGRGRKLSASAVKQRAESANIPVQQPTTLKDQQALNQFQSWQADVLIVAAYGLILPSSVLQSPKLGCLNIHASLLPRWRGAAPIHRAILAGDEQTGVCIMQMDEGLDTGDILLSTTCDIDSAETNAQLHDKLAALGAQALLRTLPLHCRNLLTPESQPDQGITYAHKVTKLEAQVDFTESAEVIDRQVRGLNPWPVAEAWLCGKRVRIWESRLPAKDRNEQSSEPGTILAVTDQALCVSTGSGSIELLTLQWPGKKAQAASVFALACELFGKQFGSETARQG